MEHLSLVTGPHHTITDWEHQAAAVLRKAGRLTSDDPDSAVWEQLTRRTLDGVSVTPLGLPRAAVADVHARGIDRSRGQQGWDIRPVFSDPDPSRSASDVLTDLENGATSLWLTLGAGGIAVRDLPVVLDKVLLDVAPVTLESDEPIVAARAFVRILEDKGVSPAPGSNLGADPIGAILTGDLADAEVPELVRTIAGLAHDKGLLGFVVDGSVVHDLGGSDVQELGYTLAAGAAYLRLLTDSGLDVVQAAALL